jgi:hypothetical protein
MEHADLTLIGNLFQMFGAAEWKACRPKLVFAGWGERSNELDERRFLVGI